MKVRPVRSPRAEGNWGLVPSLFYQDQLSESQYNAFKFSNPLSGIHPPSSPALIHHACLALVRWYAAAKLLQSCPTP